MKLNHSKPLCDFLEELDSDHLRVDASQGPHGRVFKQDNSWVDLAPNATIYAPNSEVEILGNDSPFHLEKVTGRLVKIAGNVDLDQLQTMSLRLYSSNVNCRNLGSTREPSMADTPFPLGDTDISDRLDYISLCDSQLQVASDIYCISMSGAPGPVSKVKAPYLEAFTVHGDLSLKTDRLTVAMLDVMEAIVPEDRAEVGYYFGRILSPRADGSLEEVQLEPLRELQLFIQHLASVEDIKNHPEIGLD